MKNRNIHTLVQCAILVAMSTVLSFLVLYEAPLGGSVTILSMLPICLVGLMHGPKWGFGAAFVYSIIQLITSKCFAWGLTPTVLIVCILFDYIVAFTLLGVTGFFKGKGRLGMCGAVLLAIALRMLCHYITGVTIWEASMPDTWDNVWLYSLAYNGFYMLPEAVFTMVGTIALSAVPQLWRIINGNKNA